jgi:hypothetical protein
VSRHLLRVLEGASVGEVGGDPGCANVWQPTGGAMPAAAERRRIIRQASGWPIGLSGSALPLWPPRCGITISYSPRRCRRIEVRAQHLGDGVMTRDRALLAAFFAQFHRPSGAARPEALDLHPEGPH